MTDRLRALLGWHGTRYADVKLLGRLVHVVVEITEAGTARRHGDPPPDIDMLRVFAELPVDSPVPVRSLEPVMRAALAGAPDAWVTYEGDYITRRYEPPLRVNGIVSVHRRWQEGIHAVGPFAADAPRVISLRHEPSRRSPLWHQAEEFGIGVVIESGENVDLVKPPARHLVRPGMELWSLAETVFAQVSERFDVSAGEPTPAALPGL